MLRTSASRFQDHLKPAAIQFYRVCDDLSGLLICFMAVFSPWAFGTTQPWSIWTMNVLGYLAGSLLLAKLAIRKATGYRPPRWNTQTGTAFRESSEPAATESDPGPGFRLSPAFFTRVLLVLSTLFVAYCFTSALNARATFVPEKLMFEYRDNIRWLPHSLDATSTWFWSWNFLAIALGFWAGWDWLSGKTESEARVQQQGESLFSSRVRTLLWVLSVNGGLLALEGIIQRLEGSGHLLFLVKPRVNPGAESQFGPYAYRGSAASYFNLLWPVTLGFWWTLHQYSKQHRNWNPVLLGCAILMAACPFIATSRGGATVTVGLLIAGALFLLVSQLLFASPREGRKRRWKTAVAVLVFCLTAIGIGYSLGWKALKPRMAEFQEGYRLREEMFDNAKPMARDYPLFGTGPGTFEMVFQLYRKSTDTYWPKQLHNDWLESRITLGRVGMSLVLAALATILARWFARGGIHGGRRFVGMAWLALAGCLVHARWDFPFQIYSILLLFVLLCALLFTLSRRRSWC